MAILNGPHKILEYSKSVFTYYKTNYCKRTIGSDYKWLLPIYDFEKIHLKSSSIETDEFIYLIVPEKFQFTYKPSIKEANIRFFIPYGEEIYFNVFNGSYQDCYDAIHDKEKLKKYIDVVNEKKWKISSEIRRREDEEYDNYHDYKRDTFDALTDGTYGDYDDWRNGGNFDDLSDRLGS